MITAVTLITLGVLTQVLVLATSRSQSVRFNHECQTCTYQIPPMERPPAFYDCPECIRLSSLSDPLPL
jgi:hypothetical protein